MKYSISKKLAFQFIILMGIVSLLGDIVYEGARSITGPYLQVLGASAAIVGTVAGLGDFMGYGIRILSGYISDRTAAYWPMTIIGYGLLGIIPLLGIVNFWQIAAIFIIIERIGKGIRAPARDAILSHVTKKVGRGTGFGIHEALDQIGAIIGPIIFSTAFFFGYEYKRGFYILWIPAILCIVVLFIAKAKVPRPEKLELIKESNQNKNFSKLFWIYSLFIFFSVSGFSSFQLIAYHIKYKNIMSEIDIPILYAIAMGIDALMALFIGKIYDRKGLNSLIIVPLLTLFIPFFAFSISPHLLLLGMVLWGAVMGIHETVIRAAIADITHQKKRGIAYGIFNTIYGFSWFLGSTTMGLLYDISINYIILFTILMEIASISLFFIAKKELKILNN